MAVARLNVDVFAIVCDFLTDVSDILPFALTCSTLHPIAIRRLLSMRPIYLPRSASVRRFHSFLFADKLARACHVRALEIGTRWRLRQFPEATPADDDPLLIDIIKLCPHLERVSVVLRDPSSQRKDDPRLSDAIAAIQSTRSLSIHGKLTDAVAFFRNIRAPLRMLGIHCPNPKGHFWFTAALDCFLPRFASTLEELELSSFLIDPYERQTQGNASTPSRSDFSMTQYPAVRSFSVTVFQGMPSLDHLQHLFPALDGTLAFSLSGMFPQDGLFAGVRAANQRAQDSNGDRPSSRAWNRLARVVCCVHTFYVLGLRCPIGLLMLDNVSKYNKRYLVPALRENPVPRLKLSLMLTRGVEVLDELFPQELCDVLTHITLFCVEDRHDRTDAASAQREWDDVLDRLRASLQPLRRLTHLRVVFYSVFHNDAWLPIGDMRGNTKHLRPLRRPAIELAEETATSLIRPLPSLQYVLLTATGYLVPQSWSNVCKRWRAARAWRVEGPPTDAMKDGQPTLVALHDEVAETIIRKEELVLSKADEDALRKQEDDDQ